MTMMMLVRIQWNDGYRWDINNNKIECIYDCGVIIHDFYCNTYAHLLSMYISLIRS